MNTTGDFQFVKKHVLASGHTHLGIQTAAFADGHWWFGCYGRPKSNAAPAAPDPAQGRRDAGPRRAVRIRRSLGRGAARRGQVPGRARRVREEEKGHAGRLVSAVADDDSRGMRFIEAAASPN